MTGLPPTIRAFRIASRGSRSYIDGAMRSARYLLRLLKEFAGFAGENRAWWIVPIVLLLLLLALLIIASEPLIPFIYTIF